MKVKGKFEGQLYVHIEFSPRTGAYQVMVAEWSQGRDGFDWFQPNMHHVYENWKGFPHERLFERRGWTSWKHRDKAMRYYAKAKAEQAYRHASHNDAETTEGSWTVIAR